MGDSSMTRARRLLTLAYRAHQRDEREIAARISTLAFESDDAGNLFEALSSETDSDGGEEDAVKDTEAALRKAEAATAGKIFTPAGEASLLAIAEKLHQAGLPKIAKSVAAAVL